MHSTSIRNLRAATLVTTLGALMTTACSHRALGSSALATNVTGMTVAASGGAIGGSAPAFAPNVVADQANGVAYVSLARAAHFVMLGVSPGRSVVPLAHASGSPLFGAIAGGARQYDVRVAELGPAARRSDRDRLGVGDDYDACVRRTAPQYYHPNPTPTGRDSAGRAVLTATDIRNAATDARMDAETQADRVCRASAMRAQPARERATQAPPTLEFNGEYVLLVVADAPFLMQDVDKRLRKLKVHAETAQATIEAVAEGVAAGHGDWAAYYVPWKPR